MANTYETQFTRENVRELNKHIQKQITKYASEHNKKLDLFVIVAALQQAAYEVTLRSLAENKEDARVKSEAMLPISEAIIETIDNYRVKNKSQPTEELIGAIFGSNVLVEFYAKNRDKKISALMDASEIVDDENVKPNVNAKAINTGIQKLANAVDSILDFIAPVEATVDMAAYNRIKAEAKDGDIVEINGHKYQMKNCRFIVL